MNTLVEAISADMEHLTENLLENHSSRLFSRGGHFTKDQMIPVYFALIFGCEENAYTYSNFLFSLKDDIKKTTKPIMKPSSTLPCFSTRDWLSCPPAT